MRAEQDVCVDAILLTLRHIEQESSEPPNTYILKKQMFGRWRYEPNRTTWSRAMKKVRELKLVTTEGQKAGTTYTLTPLGREYAEDHALDPGPPDTAVEPASPPEEPPVATEGPLMTMRVFRDHVEIDHSDAQMILAAFGQRP